MQRRPPGTPARFRKRSAAWCRVVVAGALMAGAVTAGVVSARAADPRDGPVAAYAVTRALETARTGTSVPWSNPETGNGGTITIRRTFYRGDGVPCRDYTRTVEGRGGAVAETVTGSGCRTGRGTWGLDEEVARRPNVEPRREPAAEAAATRTRPPAPRDADGDERRPERRPAAAGRGAATEAETPAKPAALDGSLPSKSDG